MDDLDKLTSEDRRRYHAFERLLAENPGAMRAFRSAGKKRLLVDRGLLCPSTEVAGIGAFAPHPGSMPDLEGRVVFYTLCRSHGGPQPPELIEGLIEALARGEAASKDH